MCGMTCPYGRSGARAVCPYTGGLGCGALVLVVSFVGAGQVVLPGFTSSVASLASAFAGMTVMGRCGVKRSRIAAFGDPNMVA